VGRVLTLAFFLRGKSVYFNFKKAREAAREGEDVQGEGGKE
jgi:hypothetical protein